MNIKIVTVTTFSIFMVGCANIQPIIDTKGIDMREYRTDLAECQQYANQINSGKEAAKDAGFGAVFGWALAKVTGGDAKKSASIGAVTGGSKGLGAAERSKEQIVRRCLLGRGYNVLN